jgi:hypothetical protein
LKSKKHINPKNLTISSAFLNFSFFAQSFVASSSLFRSPDHPIYGSPDAQFRQSALISRKSAAEFGCGSAMLCLSASVVEFLFQSEIKNQKSKFPPSVLRFAYA